jgi:hypothetical protein
MPGRVTSRWPPLRVPLWCLEGMFILTAIAAMEAYEGRQHETARLGRRLGCRPLQLLDPRTVRPISN